VYQSKQTMRPPTGVPCGSSSSHCLTVQWCISGLVSYPLPNTEQPELGQLQGQRSDDEGDIRWLVLQQEWGEQRSGLCLPLQSLMLTLLLVQLFIHLNIFNCL